MELWRCSLNPRTHWLAQVKRIHEYKRQFLNVLGIIWRYDQIKKMSPEQKAQVSRQTCTIRHHPHSYEPLSSRKSTRS